MESHEGMTREIMEKMCDFVRPGSTLVVNFVGDRASAESDLKRLIEAKLLNPISHLQLGIGRLEYDARSIKIDSVPYQYPSPQLAQTIAEGKESSSLLGPMSGVFIHVFDKELYGVHVRGQGIAAPGKIQIAAGMGEYGIYPADNALKEAREELGAEAELALPKNRFLDITPFMKKAGKTAFPQALFSYIATGSLGHIKTVCRNYQEVQKFIDTMPAERKNEAYPFLVPIEDLRDFSREVDSIGKDEQNPDGMWYGPVNRTVENFLSWYNSQSKTSY